MQQVDLLANAAPLSPPSMPCKKQSTL